MLWVKSLHIIFMVTWFAGLFYLPRLFVYHTQATDATSIERFKLMERRLYRGIMTPGAILTTLFGIGLIAYDYPWILRQGWMHAKLALIILLWGYHLYCGHLTKAFAQNQNTHSSHFYRWFNEIPTVILFITVILVVVRPF